MACTIALKGWDYFLFDVYRCCLLLIQVSLAIEIESLKKLPKTNIFILWCCVSYLGQKGVDGGVLASCLRIGEFWWFKTKIIHIWNFELGVIEIKRKWEFRSNQKNCMGFENKWCMMIEVRPWRGAIVRLKIQQGYWGKTRHISYIPVIQGSLYDISLGANKYSRVLSA